MSKPTIRYLRFHCPTPTSMPQANRDGALAVAAIREGAQLARMLQVDMRRWNCNRGAALGDALGVLVPAAHHRFVAAFGGGLGETLRVECDGFGGSFFLRLVGDATLRGSRDTSNFISRMDDPVGRPCYVGRAASTGSPTLDKVEAVVGGVWAGVEW